MKEFQTESTSQHGTVALTTTCTTDTVIAVGRLSAVEWSQLQHRSQLRALAVFQCINLTTNITLKCWPRPLMNVRLAAPCHPHGILNQTRSKTLLYPHLLFRNSWKLFIFPPTQH